MRRAAIVVLALALGAGCGAPVPLAHAAASPAALAHGVLDGLARRDRAGLEALAVSEQEFRERVWPALPAARPERNLPRAYVWGDLRQKSAASLADLLRRHGGRRYALAGVRFGRVADYGRYRIHRDAALSVTDEAGRALDVRVAGSMIEADGAWKVFSYVVDD